MSVIREDEVLKEGDYVLEEKENIEAEDIYALVESYNYKHTHHTRVIGVSKDFTMLKGLAKYNCTSCDIIRDTSQYNINYNSASDWYRTECHLIGDRTQYIEYTVEKTHILSR